MADLSYAAGVEKTVVDKFTERSKLLNEKQLKAYFEGRITSGTLKNKETIDAITKIPGKCTKLATIDITVLAVDGIVQRYKKAQALPEANEKEVNEKEVAMKDLTESCKAQQEGGIFKAGTVADLKTKCPNLNLA